MHPPSFPFPPPLYVPLHTLLAASSAAMQSTEKEVCWRKAIMSPIVLMMHVKVEDLGILEGVHNLVSVMMYIRKYS